MAEQMTTPIVIRRRLPEEAARHILDMPETEGISIALRMVVLDLIAVAASMRPVAEAAVEYAAALDHLMMGAAPDEEADVPEGHYVSAQDALVLAVEQSGLVPAAPGLAESH